MPNHNHMRGAMPSPARNIASGPFRDYTGANTNRRSRFEARTARRYGDWGILEIPTALLWFDEIYAELDDDNGFLGPPIIDIWP
jgi:hypothetical protein